MKVRVIASKPVLTKIIEQDHIHHLIGKVYDVKFYDTEDYSVLVEEESFGGQIVLNKGEYEILEA